MYLNLFCLASLVTSLGILISHTTPTPRRESGATCKGICMLVMSVTFVSLHRPCSRAFDSAQPTEKNPSYSCRFCVGNRFLNQQYDLFSFFVQNLAHFQCYQSGFPKPFHIPVIQIQQLPNLDDSNVIFFLSSPSDVHEGMKQELYVPALLINFFVCVNLG